MKSCRHTVFAALILAGMAFTPSLEAQDFGRIMRRLKFWSKDSRVETLIICGNYARPRLLAEMAQHKTGQPIILLSPVAGGGLEFFFLPKQPTAMPFEKSGFTDVVDMANPRQVVILGDTTHVPAEFVNLLQGRHKLMVLASNDWVRNAESLAKVCGGWRLVKHYKEQLAKLDDPDANRPPVGAEQTVVPPVSNAPATPIAAPVSTLPAPVAAPAPAPVEPLLPPIILPPANP